MSALVVLAIVLLALAGTLLYFAPFLLAWIRGSRGIGGILVLNIFLGWTLVGWVVALAWAAGGTTEDAK